MQAEILFSHVSSLFVTGSLNGYWLLLWLYIYLISCKRVNQWKSKSRGNHSLMCVIQWSILDLKEIQYCCISFINNVQQFLLEQGRVAIGFAY